MSFSYVFSCLLCDELNKRKNIINKTRRLCFVCCLQLSYFLLCTYVNCVLFLVIRYCSLFCLHNENDKIKGQYQKGPQKRTMVTSRSEWCLLTGILVYHGRSKFTQNTHFFTTQNVLFCNHVYVNHIHDFNPKYSIVLSFLDEPYLKFL